MLDSTVLIDVLRSRPDAVRRLRELQASGDVPCTCAVVVDEVSFGLKARERDAASRLFEGLTEAPLGIAEGRLAGWIRQRDRKKGRTVHQGDCLIAAACLTVGARLATGNPKDFSIKGLQVEHWPAGG